MWEKNYDYDRLMKLFKKDALGLGTYTAGTVAYHPPTNPLTSDSTSTDLVVKPSKYIPWEIAKDIPSLRDSMIFNRLLIEEEPTYLTEVIEPFEITLKGAYTILTGKDADDDECRYIAFEHATDLAAFLLKFS